MGDPGGIGPEVVLKAIAARTLSAAIEPLLVGDRAVWEETARRLGLDLRFSDTQRRGSITVAITSELEPRHRVPGPARNAASAAARGEAAYRAILEGVRLVQAGQAAALVTAPINKAHLNAAGHDFPGHTELLAKLARRCPRAHDDGGCTTARRAGHDSCRNRPGAAAAESGKRAANHCH